MFDMTKKKKKMDNLKKKKKECSEKEKKEKFPLSYPKSSDVATWLRECSNKIIQCLWRG